MLHVLEYNSWLRKKVILLFMIIILALTVVEIWAVNRLSTYGEQINKLELTKRSLHLENQVLENEIAEKSSFQDIIVSAKALGFERVKNVQIIQKVDIALNQNSHQ